VKLGFFDVKYETTNERVKLKTVHLFRVPGFTRIEEIPIVPPGVEEFLKTRIADKLFSQSLFLEPGLFEHVEIWLYDATIPFAAQGYPLPRLENGLLYFDTYIDDSRLERVNIIRQLIRPERIKAWEVAVEALFCTLFIEFVDLKEVPLYCIKNPVVEGLRPKSFVDVPFDSPYYLHFNQLLIRTR
jgi:hypothetical protein